MNQLDPGHYQTTVERLRPPLHAWAKNRVGSTDAEDLVADTLTAVWARRASYDPDRGGLDPWIWGIANLELKRYRRIHTRICPEPTQTDVAESSTEDDALANVATTTALTAAAAGIAALSATDLALITDTVATYLGITRGGAAVPLDAAARVRLHRARQRLRQTASD